MKHRLRRPQTSTSSGHAHDIPGWLLAATGLCILGLVAGVAIVGWQAVATNNRLDAVEQYVAGKGEQRDGENARLNDRIDQAVCRVLDQLPAGGRLDAVRATYGCGPGQSPAAAAPSSPAAGTLPPPSTAPRQNAPTQPTTPAVPTASAAPAPPAAAPAPLPSPGTAPRGPIVGVVCAVLPALCATP